MVGGLVLGALPSDDEDVLPWQSSYEFRPSAGQKLLIVIDIFDVEGSEGGFPDLGRVKSEVQASGSTLTFLSPV